MTDQLIDRPSTWGSIGDHERRIRALEALEDCCAQNDTCVGFPDRVSELSDAGVPLLGYWRLGETADPWADSSPFADADLTLTVAGTEHIVPHVTGCLPAAEDDGAIEFTGTSFVQGDYLTSAVTSRFEFTTTAYGVAVWVKLNSDCGAGAPSLIVGTWSPSNFGWMLATQTGQVMTHYRTATGGAPQTVAVGPAVALGDCNFIVVNWDPITGHEMFYNGVSVATDPGTTTVPAGTLRLGAMGSGGPVFGSFDGTIDELSIWGQPLTSDEITELYLAGNCNPTEAEAGMVLTADGLGGTYWAFPSITVEY